MLSYGLYRKETRSGTNHSPFRQAFSQDPISTLRRRRKTVSVPQQVAYTYKILQILPSILSETSGNYRSPYIYIQKRPLSQAVFPLLFTSGYIGPGVVAHPVPFTIHSCSSSSQSSPLVYIDQIAMFSTLIYLRIFMNNAIFRFAKIAIFARFIPYYA